MYHYVENSANRMRISLPSYDILMTSRSFTYHYVEDSVSLKGCGFPYPPLNIFVTSRSFTYHYVEYSVFFRKDADFPTLL